MTTDQPLQDQALDHIRELLTAHWREAKDSADEEGEELIHRAPLAEARNGIGCFPDSDQVYFFRLSRSQQYIPS